MKIETSRALLRGASTLALFLAIGAVEAQAAEIRGRDTDAAGGSALPGATIHVEGAAIEAVTGDDGGFVIRDVAAGPQTLVVDYVGYPTLRQPAQAADAPAVVQIRLDNGGAVAALVVTGQRLAERRALQVKKIADNQVESLFADDVGKLPDQNVAEAIRRLPGLSVANDQGEGRYVIIRGVNPALANVTLNGQTAAAPEPESRQVKLDDIPSALIGSVNVIKTLTADLDANAIAGQVDIDTISAFDRSKPFLFARGAYGEYDLNKKHPYEGDVTVGGQFGPDKQFAAVFSANYSRRPIHSENLQGSSNWQVINGQVVPDDFRPRSYNLVRERTGFVGNFDWRPNEKTKLYLRTLYSKFSDDENRDQFRIELPTSAGAISNQTATTGTFGSRGTHFVRRRQENDHTYSISSGGSFEVGPGKLNIDGAYTRAVKEDPLRSEFQFRSGSNAFTATYDTSDLLFNVTPTAGSRAYDPSLYNFQAVNYDRRKAEENLAQAKVDYSLPFSGLGEGSMLKFGAKILDRKKKNDRNLEAYTPGVGAANAYRLSDLNPPTGPAIYDGRYPLGPLVVYDTAQAFFDTHPGARVYSASGSLANSLVNDYRVSETISAAYVMATLKFDKLTVIPGVRLEHTKGDYLAKSITAASTPTQGFNLSGDNSYTDVFPGVNLRYDVDKSLVLRGAATTAIGRPDYAQLAPFVQVDAGAATVSKGNPDLKPLKSLNFDAAIEYYLPNQGVLSAGVFYKRIEDPIYSQGLTVTGQTFAGVLLPSAQVTSPANAERATVKGIEFNAQSQLTFLPSPLDGFGVSANITLVDADATGVFGRSDKAPLSFQSKTVGSAQLFYEKYGFSARVAYSYRSHYLDTVGSSAATDQYTADFGQWDARASYAANRNVIVFVEGSNLNNRPWRRWIGNDRQLVEQEQYGYSVRAGVQLKF
jgi:TonB-dependent receptor